jgi:hypothetical protein
VVGSAREPEVVHWACAYGHVFRAALPAPGELVQCPEVVLGDGPCLTSFVLEPFDSDQDALEAARGEATPRPNWAPWAGPRHPACDRLAYWSAG